MPLFNDVGVEGQALETFGFEAFGQVQPSSLLTNGLLWPQPGFIWNPCNYGFSTSWVGCSLASGATWTTCGAAPSTTWSLC